MNEIVNFFIIAFESLLIKSSLTGQAAAKVLNYCSSVASMVMVAFISFDTGQPSLAVRAACANRV